MRFVRLGTWEVRVKRRLREAGIALLLTRPCGGVILLRVSVAYTRATSRDSPALARDG